MIYIYICICINIYMSILRIIYINIPDIYTLYIYSVFYYIYTLHSTTFEQF